MKPRAICFPSCLRGKQLCALTPAHEPPTESQEKRPVPEEASRCGIDFRILDRKESPAPVFRDSDWPCRLQRVSLSSSLWTPKMHACMQLQPPGPSVESPVSLSRQTLRGPPRPPPARRVRRLVANAEARWAGAWLTGCNVG